MVNAPFVKTAKLQTRELDTDLNAYHAIHMRRENLATPNAKHVPASTTARVVNV
jgi:hypothetical protein